MKNIRGQTNAFSVGKGSYVLVIPKEIEKELEMDKSKKTFFKIYTDYKDEKKKIIYELVFHTKKSKNQEAVDEKNKEEQSR